MPQIALSGRYKTTPEWWRLQGIGVNFALQMQPMDKEGSGLDPSDQCLLPRPVRVRLLGGLDVRTHEGPVTFPTRHAALLFAYLAMQPGVSQTRTHLAGLFWSERGEDQARGSLRQTIFRIRRVFAGIEPEVISADGQSVAVNPRAIRSDLGDLDSAICDAAPGLFLAGWDGVSPDIDAWIRAERDRIGDTVRAILQARAERAEAEGDNAALIEASRQMTVADPYDEQAARWLMTGFALSGNAAAADDIFRKLTTRLRDDLQIEPDSETARLAAEIAERTGRFAPRYAAVVDPVPVLDAGAVRECRLVTVVSAWALPSDAADADTPKKVHAIRQRCEAAFAKIIARFGGKTDRAPGLVSFSYFGWPVASEDAASLAVQAALEIQRIAPCRIGISSGKMLIESDLDPVGAPPDQAMALMLNASSGEVLISAATQELTAGKFLLRDTPNGTRAVGSARLTNRFAARNVAAPAEMIGRQREFDLVMDRLGRASEGDGQLVVLTGEPGIGKTRFHEEIARAALEYDARRILLQCEQRGQGTPFKPVLDHIAIAAGLSRAGDTKAQADRLNAHLEEAGVTDPEHVAVIAHLLRIGSEPGGPDANDMVPADRRAGVIASLLSYFLGAHGGWLTFVVLDDAHWADPSTLELIEHLCSSLGENKLFILLIGRPELDVSTLPSRFRTDLSLQGLSRSDALLLIRAHLAGVSEPEAQVAEKIIDLADGVPLFLEELTRSYGNGDATLGDPREVTPQPLTLKAALEARIQRLGPHRHVAQRAACIGRQFDRASLLAACGGDIPDVDQALAAMLQERVIFRYLGNVGEEYFFCHALVADTAQDNLTGDDRRETHRRLFDHFRHGDTAPIETIARHAVAADLHREALTLYKDAGSKALAEFAHREARALFNEALAQLPHLRFTEESEDDRLDIMGKLSLCVAHDLGYGHPETTGLLGEAQRLAVARPSSRYAIPILWQTYSMHYTQADGNRAREVGEQILKLRAWNDAYGPQEALGQRFIAAGNLILGRFCEADAAFCIATEALNRPTAPSSVDAMGVDQMIPIGMLHARVRTILGHEDDARSMIDETLAMADRKGLIQARITAHVLAAQTMLILGDFEATRSLAAISLQLSSDRHSSMWAAYSNGLVGIADLHLNADPEAADRFYTGRKMLHRSKTIVSTTILDAMFATALVQNDEVAAAQPYFRAASDAIACGAEPWCQAEVIRLDLTANPATLRHDTEAAADLLSRAEALAADQKAALWAGRLARLRQVTGRQRDTT